MSKSDDALQRGRRAYVRRRWAEAHESLVEADAAAPLGTDDLELLATALYMLGRDDESWAVSERAHHVHLEAGETLLAARRAIWIGTNLALRGEVGPGTGWLARAQRLLETVDEECVERGYALLPMIFRHAGAGDLTAAAATAAQAVEIAQQFDDPDLFALAAHARGQMLIKDRRVEEGLALLDEAMVVAMGDDLNPIHTGIVYCGVILACQEVYELRRAQEWTEALTRWCDEQEDLLAFTGRCLVHRAEVMQVHGSWPDALEEAKRATLRLIEVGNLGAAGFAFYRVGELLRLQGSFEAAEEAYTSASRHGWEPQPGLALLRLAQGRPEAAAAIRRVLGETTEPLRRAGLLPACVEIMLAIGAPDEARASCRELEEITESFESGMLGALVAQSRGAVELADGDPREALVELRAAWHEWQALGAPYEAARIRVLIGVACRALGDGDAATLELEAARETFERLGAAPDLARLDTTDGRPSSPGHGLTPRELEVLRLLAAGRSNREVATALVISEHTVARHVQNIFTKLRISSRAAATAFAYEHDLV